MGKANGQACSHRATAFRRHGWMMLPLLPLAVLVACGTEEPGHVTSSTMRPTVTNIGRADFIIPSGTSWQWQLDGEIDTTVDVEMYDIDLFEAPQDVIDDLHDEGRIVICYFSAGSFEGGRSDADQFPLEALGETLENWPDERWFDIRHSGVRAVLKLRLDLAVVKRCDGVEPDNMDGFANDSGFPLTSSDQLDFNRFLAAEAHARRLSVGLKNDLDHVGELEPLFDWALDEECVVYDECEALMPFINAGKAVFHVEYGEASLAASVCRETASHGFSTLIKRFELDAWRIACSAP